MNPPELASTVAEHESAALYHEESERAMREAGRTALAEAHKNAAMLHRQAIRLGPEKLWVMGDYRINEADDSPRQHVPSYGEFARMWSQKAKDIEANPKIEKALER